MPNPKGNPATLTKKYEPKWKYGKTQTIRVPIALANEILDYAHQLDDGNVKADAVATEDQDAKLRETLTQVIAALEQVCETPHTSKFTRLIKAQLTAYAINPLKALTQPNESVE
jgi:hypothetical protein